MKYDPTSSLLRYGIALSVIFLSPVLKGNAQDVTEIITSYGGYWKSSSSIINSIKPDNSHNLLAFTVNGTRYSTGINDALLGSHGDSYTSGDFRALSIAGMTGTVTSNTKVGLGAMYDGVFNGASNPPPANNIPYYMTDGPHGLDLGTGIANLPAGVLNLSVSNLQSSSIGDGKPDMLVTQIADPSGTADQYEFTDINGVRVGNLVTVSFSAVNAVGNWTADFYEASVNPMTLQAGFTQTDRPLRLWAADFSSFGITGANYTSIARFVIHLNGNSDIAFVAYNNQTVTLLPVSLSFFHSAVVNNDIQLSWQTQTESNSSYFAVETSTDGQHFTTLDTIAAAGNSSSTLNYSYLHVHPGAGIHFYRLKQVDIDGRFTYSIVVKETILSSQKGIGIYPNPSSGQIIIMHPAAIPGDRIEIFTISGILLTEKRPIPGSTQTSFDLNNFSRGIYFAVISNTDGQKGISKIILE